jgi:hypothetical protein
MSSRRSSRQKPARSIVPETVAFSANPNPLGLARVVRSSISVKAKEWQAKAIDRQAKPSRVRPRTGERADGRLS